MSESALIPGVARLLINRGYLVAKIFKVESHIDDDGMTVIEAIWMDSVGDSLHVEIELDHSLKRELVWVTRP